jgi:hypothetical protein
MHAIQAMEVSIRGEMTVQFEVVNPATLELKKSKVNQIKYYLYYTFYNRFLSVFFKLFFFNYREDFCTK